MDHGGSTGGRRGHDFDEVLEEWYGLARRCLRTVNRTREAILRIKTVEDEVEEVDDEDDDEEDVEVDRDRYYPLITRCVVF
jgi:hypothetical protein